MYRVYIWGDGNSYNKLTAYLGSHLHKLEVIGIISNYKAAKYIDGYPILYPEEAEWEHVDYIIVASVSYKEILDQIRRKWRGMENKVIRSEVFQIPWFSIDEYLKIKHSQVSILSNYCLGGWIYRELGLEMLSPTINMYCLGMNYIKFLKNVSYYMQQEMTPYCNQTYISGTIGQETFCPKGRLGNEIIWYFNHDATAEDAIEEWDRRKKRVNYKNMVALMTIQSDEEAYEFSKLKFRRKLGFYYKDLCLDSVAYCPEWNNPKIRAKHNFNWPHYINANMVNINGNVGQIDWIKFLNHEGQYLRKKGRIP